LTKLLLPYEPLYRCRKMIAVNSVYDLERLISNFSGSDSAISSLYEEETTPIRREACSDEAIMVAIGRKTERQDVCNEGERSCFNSVEGCSKKEQRNNPCQHRKSTESPIPEPKDPLDEQRCNPSEGLNEMLTDSQENIPDGQDPLLTDLRMENLEESLQSSSSDKVSETQAKISPKVWNDKKVEKTVALNSELQNFGRKDMKEVQKSIQKLYQKFNRLCSLISDLLNILHLKVNPKSAETTMNPEDFHLTPLRLIAVTNALARRISGNPFFKRILVAKDPSQIRCYKCNKIGHIARYCRNKKKSSLMSRTTGYNLYKYQE